MKVEVIAPFNDKHNLSIGYKVGEILDWDDLARIDNCISRGLVKLAEEAKEEKPKKKTTKKAKQA